MSAPLINIAGLTPVHDPAYRYKMPRLVGKVEGRGNGIKTALMNVDDISLALKRDPAEITKFFGCELGSQTSFTTTTDGKGDTRAIVNGSHRDQDLQTHLSKYIENFVLCNNCHLPETHYKIKDGLISQKCLACGSSTVVDMTHKLTTFILAQHKRNKDLKKKEEKEAAKEGKKEKKEKKDKGEKEEKPSKSSSRDGNATGGGDESPDNNGEKQEKVKKSTKSKTSPSPQSPTNGGDSAPENVFGITSASVSAASEDESDSKAAEEGMDRFKAFLSNHPGISIKEQVEELKHIQTMASLRPSDRCIIYLGAVFSEAVISGNESVKHKDMLVALAPSEIQQRHLIAGFEWLIGTKFSALMKLFPKLLMQLYDAEIIEEDTFLAWAADTTRNEYTAEQSMISFETLETLHASAAPFVKWLQEAEEEGEDGDEEDEEEEGDEEEDDASGGSSDKA